MKDVIACACRRSHGHVVRLGALPHEESLGRLRGRLSQGQRVRLKHRLQTECGCGVGGGDRLPLSEQQSLWLLEGCDRVKAEALLRGRPDGTFLIRRASSGEHALTIVALGKVQHCVIVQSERGVGFSQPYAIYPSLAALVDHYAEHELGEYNEQLPTRLLHPARTVD